MDSGVFLLVCVLALAIGTKLRQNNDNRLSEKALKQREKIKRIMMTLALGLVAIIFIQYIPAVYTEIIISLDTRFSFETYMSIAIVVVTFFTGLLIIKRLYLQKK